MPRAALTLRRRTRSRLAHCDARSRAAVKSSKGAAGQFEANAISASPWCSINPAAFMAGNLSEPLPTCQFLENGRALSRLQSTKRPVAAGQDAAARCAGGAHVARTHHRITPRKFFSGSSRLSSEARVSRTLSFRLEGFSACSAQLWSLRWRAFNDEPRSLLELRAAGRNQGFPVWLPTGSAGCIRKPESRAAGTLLVR